MKANELMIGDWVRNDLNEVQQVVELREGRIMLAYNDMYDYDEIDPIPITPEILEKNGFEKQGFDGWEYNIYGQANGDYLCSVLWRTDYGIPHLMIESHSSKHGSFRSFEIRYVHELQHALRLCGIEKIIEPL